MSEVFNVLDRHVVIDTKTDIGTDHARRLPIVVGVTIKLWFMTIGRSPIAFGAPPRGVRSRDFAVTNCGCRSGDFSVR